ncbi:Exportin-1 [Cucumispora dikerogammari]|nr:Exportin-1 [Cucumispora dikerogammari]
MTSPNPIDPNAHTTYSTNQNTIPTSDSSASELPPLHLDSQVNETLNSQNTVTPSNTNLIDSFTVEAFDEQIKLALQMENPIVKKEAEYNLMKFKASPTSFQYISPILTTSHLKESHAFALKILDSTINNNWSTFSRSQKDELRQYIINQVLFYAKTTSFKETNLKNSINLVLNKFNYILLNVVKREYPKYLQTFISDILSVSIQTEPLIFNNSLCLINSFVVCLNKQKYLFNTVRYALMVNKVKTEVTQIILEVISYLMINKELAYRNDLLNSCFELLPSLIRYFEYREILNVINVCVGLISGPYVLSVIEVLIESVINLKLFNCEIESAPSTVKRSEEITKITYKILTTLNEFLTQYFIKFKHAPLADCYTELGTDEKRFLFLVCSLKKELLEFSELFLELECSHIERINNRENGPQVEKAIQHLFKCFEISEMEMEVVILECFLSIFSPLLVYNTITTGHDIGTNLDSQDITYKTTQLIQKTMGGSCKNKLISFIIKKRYQQSIIHKICKKMPRPVEILITLDASNNIIQNRLTNTEYISYVNKYRSLIRKILLISYHYDVQTQHHDLILNSIETTIISLLEDQTENFNLKPFNNLIYTLTNYSNLLPSKVENNFYSLVLRNLLNQADAHSVRINRAFVASNIIYVVGSFPIYLKENKSFMKIVLLKLIEFMSEDLEGIREMASETFLTLFSNETLIHDLDTMKELFAITVGVKLERLENYQKQNVYKGIVCLLAKIRTAINVNRANMYNTRGADLIKDMVQQTITSLSDPRFLTNSIIKNIITMKQYETKMYKECIHILKSLTLISEGFALDMRLDFTIFFRLLEYNDNRMNNEILCFFKQYIGDYIDQFTNNSNSNTVANSNTIDSEEEKNYIKNIISSILSYITHTFDASPSAESLKIFSVLLSKNTTRYLGNKFEFETGLFYKIINPILNIPTPAIIELKENDDDFLEAYCDILSQFSLEFFISLIQTEVFNVLLTEQLTLFNEKNKLQVIKRFTEIFPEKEFSFKILNCILINLFDKDKECVFAELSALLVKLIRSKNELVEYVRVELVKRFGEVGVVDLFLKGILFIKNEKSLEEHFVDYKILFVDGILDEYFELEKEILEKRIVAAF